jgi:hypothetical protein
VLGVMLGNGMYNVPGSRYTKFVGSFGPPKLTLCLVVSQGNRKQIITSDTTWQTDDGPIAFSCIYGGEDYDARREQPGWDTPGFDDGRWKPVKVVDGPGGKLRPATSPPIRVVRYLEPVSVTKLNDGRYEVDLGENLSARPVIQVKGKGGSTGYEKVLIDPFIPDDLEWAQGSFDSPNGRIEVAWVRKDGTVEVSVKAERAEVEVARERKNI